MIGEWTLSQESEFQCVALLDTANPSMGMCEDLRTINHIYIYVTKHDPFPLPLAIQFVRLASLDIRLCQRIRVYHRIAIWGFLKMGDPQVALGFNTKS